MYIIYIVILEKIVDGHVKNWSLKWNYRCKIHFLSTTIYGCVLKKMDIPATIFQNYGSMIGKILINISGICHAKKKGHPSKRSWWMCPWCGFKLPFRCPRYQWLKTGTGAWPNPRCTFLFGLAKHHQTPTKRYRSHGQNQNPGHTPRFTPSMGVEVNR